MEKSLPLSLTKLAGALALTLLAVACKKEDAPAPAPPSGETANTTPQRAIEPEEECAQQCHVTAKLSAKSEARLAALDDCVMEACYNDEPLEDPTVIACEGVGPGSISYGLAERDRCIARSCCTAARECWDDASCAAHLGCVTRCQAR